MTLLASPGRIFGGKLACVGSKSRRRKFGAAGGIAGSRNFSVGDVDSDGSIHDLWPLRSE
jgi:hypothetical protein